MEHSQADITTRISERQMRLWNALHSGKRGFEQELKILFRLPADTYIYVA
jgi:hypothetical protein